MEMRICEKVLKGKATIFLKYFIISRGFIGIFCIAFPYHGYIITRIITYTNIGVQ